MEISGTLTRVLICDDDIADRKLLKTFISQITSKNIALVEAESREQIQDTLTKGRFDIILMDIQMPEKSGMEWLSEIVDRRLAPVIMLSGFGDEEVAAESIEKGASGYIAKNKLSADKLVKAIDNALIKWHQIELSKASQEELEKMANFDSLTKLLNRGAIMRLLDDKIKYAHRYGQHLSLIMLDIDHFKKVNDTYGHITGDTVLEKVAGRIAKNIRESDTAGRYGGEEFLVILPNADTEAAAVVAERIRKSIDSEPIECNQGDSLKVTISGGVATYKQNEDNLVLINRADEALYKAKDNGRNRTEIETIAGS